MSAIFSYEITGQERVITALASLKSEWVDLTRVEKSLTQKFEDANRVQFASEGGKSGGWEKLSDAYAREKAKTHPGKTILRRDDHLYDALTESDSDAIRVFDKLEAQMGAGGEAGLIGAWHQLGKGHLPVREVLAYDSTDISDYRAIIVDDARDYAEALGFEAI